MIISDENLDTRFFVSLTFGVFFAAEFGFFARLLDLAAVFFLMS